MKDIVRKAPLSGASYLKRIWCGAEHAQADLHRAHRAEDPLCWVCGCKGTLSHRHWECPLLRNAREQLKPELLAQATRQSLEGESPFWKDLLLPHPLAVYPLLNVEEDLTWTGQELGRHQYFSGNCYTDGSGKDVKPGHVSRAGGAAVMMTHPQKIDIGVSGPLPGPLQTVPLAELYMVEVTLRHSLPPVDLAIDCFSIITALLQGKKACCSPGRLGAHIWSRI